MRVEMPSPLSLPSGRSLASFATVCALLLAPCPARCALVPAATAAAANAHRAAEQLGGRRQRRRVRREHGARAERRAGRHDHHHRHHALYRHDAAHATTPATATTPAVTTPGATVTATKTTTTTPLFTPTQPSQASSAHPSTVVGAHPSSNLSTPAIVAAVLAALIALGCAVWAIARMSAYEPRWTLSLRHAMAEAGFRASATWAEFTDWARLGR